MFKFLKNPFIIYTIIWLVYMMQGILFGGTGGILGQLLLVILLLWSMAFVIKITANVPSSIKILIALLLLYVLYGLIPIINAEIYVFKESGEAVSSFSYLKSALLSLTPIFAYYYFSKRGYITETNIRWLAIFFFVIIIANFYHSEKVLLAHALERGSNAEEFTNNVGYEFLCMFPYLFFFKRKYALPLMAGISIFLILAMKRGAILIGVMCMMYYLYKWMQTASRKSKLLVLLGIIAFVVWAGYFVVDYYNGSPYFQQRIEQTLEGHSSGRDELTKVLMNYYINEASTFEQVFGCGAYGTLKHASNYAHNDWIEMLIDQGLIGALFLLAFFVALFFDVRRMRKINRTYYFAFMMLFFIVFTKTFFSMSICAMQPYTTLLVGYFLYKVSSIKSKKLPQ